MAACRDIRKSLISPVFAIIAFLYLIVYAYQVSVMKINANCQKIGNATGEAIQRGEKNYLSTSNKTDRSAKTTLEYPNIRSCGLTLFTSAPGNSRRPLVFQNTLDNWPFMKKWNVTLILFTDDNDLCEKAKRAGWNCSPILRTAGADNRPVLPTMFLHAMLSRRGCLYGFANADILFDETLIKSLEAVLSVDTFKGAKKPLFITGRRYRVNRVTSQDAVDLVALRRKTFQTGRLDTEWAVDVFITSSDYPWITMPDIVIGLAHYDNFLIARTNEITNLTIDISKTMLAVHQSTPTDDLDRQRKYDEYNADLIKKIFGAFRDQGGRIICTFFVSVRTLNGIVFERRQREQSCAVPVA